MNKTSVGTRGFSIVEVMIAVVVAGIVSTSVISGVVGGVRSARDAGLASRAVFLAEEGLFAAQNMRDADYANLAVGTWGVTGESGQWEWSRVPDEIDGFIRSVTVSAVSDAEKSVTSTVSWTRSDGSERTYALETKLTNWLAETVVPVSEPPAE